MGTPTCGHACGTQSAAACHVYLLSTAQLCGTCRRRCVTYSSLGGHISQIYSCRALQVRGQISGVPSNRVCNATKSSGSSTSHIDCSSTQTSTPALPRLATWSLHVNSVDQRISSNKHPSTCAGTDNATYPPSSAGLMCATREWELCCKKRCKSIGERSGVSMPMNPLAATPSPSAQTRAALSLSARNAL